MESDNELFLKGTDAAMTQLVGRYERPLFRFLVRLTRDPHQAEDLFQETFLRLHRARGQFDAGAPLKPYLYRIALNVFRDALDRKNRKTLSLDQPASSQSDAPLRDTIPSDGAAQPSPEDNEVNARIRDAVDRLPEHERTVVILRMFEELSFQEIAEAMQTPVATAKSRMLYALRRLRPMLEAVLGSDSLPNTKEAQP